jgi:predicted SprT family Zn-dependent metalloprotease
MKIMTQEEAQRLFDGLVRKHLKEHWILRFTNSARSLGITEYKHRLQTGRVNRIGLSKHYLAHTSYIDMLDVIKHEFAHAIEFERHNTSSHGWRWKQMCRITGADPSRLYQGETPTAIKQMNRERRTNAKTVYELTCPNCGRVVIKNRKPNATLACGSCCRKYNHNRHSNEYLFKVERIR